jgi:predicted RNA-binding Zn ribbon-like protein
MSRPATTPFIFVGNHRALDFVNTEIASEGRPRDLLTGLDDLAGWLVRAGALEPGAAHASLVRWGGRRRGESAVEAARELRGALRRLARAWSEGKPVPRATVARVNELLARGAGTSRIVPATDGEGFTLERGVRVEEPEDLLVPIAEAAADLLCHADPGRVRQCAHPDCVLYFLDVTKNGTRRWCDMRSCGNRTNAAAYYRRRRAEPSRSPSQPAATGSS